MEKCGGCSADVFSGQGCISCGHINGASQPAATSTEATASDEAAPVANPLADLMAGNGAGTGLRSQLRRVPKQKILMGLGALAVVAVGFTAFLGRGADPATEEAANSEPAAATADAEVVNLTGGVEFCESPGPVEGAPAPDPNGINIFASYYKQAGDGWAKLDPGPFSAADINQFADMSDLSAVPVSQAPAYVSCLAAVATGNDRTCTGYDGGARHTIYGAKYTMTTYQLSNGEAVLDGPVRTDLNKKCPPVIVGSRSSGQFLPQPFDVAMWNADLAAPHVYTNAHLGRDLKGNSPTWCQSPAPLANKPASTTPGVKVLFDTQMSFAGDAVQSSSFKMSELSHVACITFVPNGEDTECDFDGGNKTVQPKGEFTATIVEMATGEVTGSQTMADQNGCQAMGLFNPSTRVNLLDPKVPQELGTWVSDQFAIVE